MKQILAFEKGTTSNDDAPDTLERAITLSQLYFGFSENPTASKPMIGTRSQTRRI
jgi:hypothetical protein